MKKLLDSTEIKALAATELEKILTEAIFAADSANHASKPAWLMVRTAIETLAPGANSQSLVEWASLSLVYGLSLMSLERVEALKFAYVLASKAESK